MNYCRTFFTSLFIITLLFFTTNSYAQDDTDRTIIASNPLISSRVKNMVHQNEKLGNKRNILFLSNNISLLQKDLIANYDGEMVISEYPQTEQELLSQAINTLSRYLCLHRSVVLQEYSSKDYYPIVDGSLVAEGSCYRDYTLLRQDGIRSYTIPEIGTLQTIPLALLKDLGQSTQNLEQYLNSDDLYPSSSDIFFFEGNARQQIIPLMNLTELPSMKLWKRKFDKVKAILYTETSEYPFTSGQLMISIFAQKGDHLIKITTPYGVLHHDMLEKVMNLTQTVFVASIQDQITDRVLSYPVFTTYYSNLIDHSLNNDLVLKNMVHYYLSLLWQYDEQPEEFIKSLVPLLEYDITLQSRIQTSLEQLQAFL